METLLAMHIAGGGGAAFPLFVIGIICLIVLVGGAGATTKGIK